MERSYDVEHLFLKAICGGFVFHAGIRVIENALFAGASGAGITASVATDATGKLVLPESKSFIGCHSFDLCNLVETVGSKNVAVFAHQFIVGHVLFALAVDAAFGQNCVGFHQNRCVVIQRGNGEVIESGRFDEVARLEAMTPDERFAFWQNELSRCIRCNACRDACPACTCEKCVFDNPNSGVENKSPANEFEEKLFHIIRAYHVAGRCTDCGECSRVCPQNIPLHLLNRKFIKDMNDFYGDYQAGEEVGSRAPLVNYTTEDLEPGEVFERGAN